MAILLLVALLIQSVPSAPAASIQRPNFSGDWTDRTFFGRAPLGFINERSICQLPPEVSPRLTPAPDSLAEGDQVTPIGSFEGRLTIQQSDAQMVVGRTYSGTLGRGKYADVFKLDGTESVTTIGVVRSATRSRWEGASLVVDHQLRWDANGREVGCNVRETFSLDDPDTLRIVAFNSEAVGNTTSTQTWGRAPRR